MINILAQANMTKKTWSFSDDVPTDVTLSELVQWGESEISVNVGYVAKTSPVVFDDMSTVLTISLNGELVVTLAYPERPIETTDMPYCFSSVLRLNPGDVCVIDVSVTNGGDTWVGSKTIEVDNLEVPGEAQ